MTLVNHRVHAPSPVLTLSERLANAAVSCVAYLGQFFVPVNLSVFYSYPATGWPAWQVAAAMLLLLAITAAAVVCAPIESLLLCRLVLVRGNVAPRCPDHSLRAHARADRYTYLPQIGLTIALVWGAMRLVAAWPARRSILAVSSALVLSILLVCAMAANRLLANRRSAVEACLGLRSEKCHGPRPTGPGLEGTGSRRRPGHNADRHSALAKGDRDFYFGTRARACSLLASLASHEGNLPEARTWLEQAVNICPDFTLGHTQLGQLLVGQREFDEAESHFRRCIQLEPANPHAYCNLAMALAKAGQLDEAIAACRQATKIDPDLGVAEWDLAVYLAQSGRRDEAIAHLRRLIQLEPDNPRPYYRLANLLRAQGKRSEAVEFDQRGNQAGVRLAKAKNRRGTELVGEGKLDEAIAQFRAAIEADPGNAQAHCNLADALAQQGKTAEAADQYRQALEIAPDFAPARRGLEKLKGR